MDENICVAAHQAEAHTLEIVVSDTSIGIKTKFKGGRPGLGLAIARGIVETHGGKIWVEGERHDEAVCPGSRFYVRLPVK